MKHYSISFLFALLLFSLPSHAEQTLQPDSCNKDNTSECMRIADDFFDIEGFDESLKYYVSLCALEVGKGCRRTGWIHDEVLGSQFELVKEAYQKACLLDDMMGCNNLGYAYENNSEIDKANTLYNQACNGNNSIACNNLGVNFEYGSGVELNHKKASELYIKSCGFKFAKACENAGDLYYYKFKNYKVSLKWYKTACSLDSGAACYDVAYQYKKGEGTKENILKANKFYKKSCELHEGKGCTALGIAYMDYNYEDSNIKQDYTKGVALFERSCKMSHGSGCYHLGRAYSNGYGVQKNDETALQFYQVGCNDVYNYSGSACYNAGWYYETGVIVASDVSLARQYYEKGCQDDHDFSCKNLAALDTPLFIDDVTKAAVAKAVFITERQFNGDLGGSVGADDKCQTEADAADSKVKGRVFKAWISGARQKDTIDAKRTLFRSKSPYQLVDGSLLAKDFKSLVNSGPEHFINMFANGKSSSERFELWTWTGISDRGETLELNCSDWHSSGADDLGAKGDALEHSLWSDFYQSKCSDKLRLYCFEQ